MELHDLPKPEDLMKIDLTAPRDGVDGYSCRFQGRHLQLSGCRRRISRYLDLPNPREWSPADEDWKLPDNWKEIILTGFKERLEKYRSFRLFMDICVRCGACADKCHFFLGSGDPKNMPVLRAELIRSVYRNDFTIGRKDSRQIGGRKGADRRRAQRVVLLLLTSARNAAAVPSSVLTASTQAEVTMIGRELLNLVGLQHQLGDGAGGQLFQDRKPPWNSPSRPQGHVGIHGGRHRRHNRHKG